MCMSIRIVSIILLYLFLAELASNEPKQVPKLIDTAMIKVSDVSVNSTRKNLYILCITQLACCKI